MVLTLAVGIGLNLGAFRYLAYLVVPTIPAPEPSRVVWLNRSTPDDPTAWISYPDWRDLRGTTAGTLESHAAYRILGLSVRAVGGPPAATPEGVPLQSASLHAWGFGIGGDYFGLFGARPQLGRLLTPEDDRPGSPRVVVLSDTFWRQRLGGDPGWVGATLRLDGRHDYTVVGIAEPGFQGQGFALSLYLPLATTGDLQPQLELRDGGRGVNALARLAPGVEPAAAEAALAAAGTRLDRAWPQEVPRRFTLRRATDWNGRSPDDPLRPSAVALMSAVGLLLLLACANVAHLLLARAVARRREMGVLAALGADRRRLGLQLVVESTLLAAAGGALGLVVGRGVVHLIEGYLLLSTPVGLGDWARGSSLFTDGRLEALFFVAVVAATGLVCGGIPALQAMRLDPVRALRDGAADGRRRRLAPRRLLVVAQVALSVVLLVGATLLVRSVQAVRAVDPGFDARGVLVAALFQPTRGGAAAADEGTGGPGEPSPLARRYDDVLERSRELPAVTAAALTHRLPLTSFSRPLQVRPASSAPPSSPGSSGEGRQNGAPGRPEAGAPPAPVDHEIVSPGFFATLRIPVLRGRVFDSRDAAPGARTVVVSRSAAERLWPQREALGAGLVVEEGDGGTTYRVVGVVADIRTRGLFRPPEPTLYFDHHQRSHRRLSLLLRTDGGGTGGGGLPEAAAALREMLGRRHPEMAVIDLVPFREQERRTLGEERMVRDLGVGFGLLGLALAALGIFSIVTFGVRRRVREIGVRRAVGATPGRVRRMVLAETLVLAGTGLAVGLAAAFPLVRALSSLVQGVPFHDPVSFLLAPALLLAVALLAAWLPAHRAAKLRPWDALRSE